MSGAGAAVFKNKLNGLKHRAITIHFYSARLPAIYGSFAVYILLVCIW